MNKCGGENDNDALPTTLPEINFVFYWFLSQVEQNLRAKVVKCEIKYPKNANVWCIHLF